MPRRHLRRVRRRIMSPMAWRLLLTFWLGALLVGASALLLAYGSDWAHLLFRRMVGVNPYLPLVVLPVGMVLITLMMRLFPGAEGSGIPQAIAALHVHDKGLRSDLLSLRIAFGKTVMVLLGLACGASIGREGPTVHVGAAIMDAMRHFGRLPHGDYRRGLILAGASAGLAAAFNTPLAGVVFAIEELSRSFEQRIAGTTMTAAILAGMIALAVHGKYYYFGTVSADADWLPSLLAIAVCSVVGGLLGGAFSLLLVHGGRRLAPYRRRHAVLIAAACGLAAAVIGVASGDTTFATGYDQARAALNNTGGLGLLYPLLKWLATLACYWSGIPGGIFAPSLSIGAVMGQQLAGLLPMVPVGALALLGMAAYFSGVVQAPLTAVVIVMEMTDSHSMLLPVMAVSLLAHAASRIVCPRPVYRALAEDFVLRAETRPAHRPT